MNRYLPLLGIMIIFLITGCTTTGNIFSSQPILDSGMPVLKEINEPNIKIASWNIENFGKIKAEDPERMEKIASILDGGYDIIAVQEISNVREQDDPNCDRNKDACPNGTNCGLIYKALDTYLNTNKSKNYHITISPHVKDERYMYIYNPETVEILNAELVYDPDDIGQICDSKPESTGKMVRQPYKAKFRTEEGFDFILLTVHTSPSINIQELEGLDYFYQEIEKEGEPDIIILGDLNADCNYLKVGDETALRDQRYTWVVNNRADTTVSITNCAYDRFVFTSSTLEDYTGNWGVVKDITDDISDHYLVWVQFYTGRDTDKNLN